MYSFEIKRYCQSDKAQWNEFIKNSRNGTFLFDRDYMDYHSDRFTDHSLLAFRNGKLSSVLPANIVDDKLYSHQGLTYGSWVIPMSHFDGNMMLSLWNDFLEYCRQNGINEVFYKTIPHIYHKLPAEEDIYALFRNNARLHISNLSSTIDLRVPHKFNMSKRQQLRKTEAKEQTINESSDYPAFWQILSDCLNERHEASPVHSLDEIRLLASRFPKNIRLFTISDEEGMQAGVCIYDTGDVAHSQYTATTAKARENYYLVKLYHHLIFNVFADRKYFDFGISNEQQGQILNAGLLNQKYSMGGSGMVYNQYHINLRWHEKEKEQ